MNRSAVTRGTALRYDNSSQQSTQTVFSPGTREDESEATKEWLTAMTETILSTVRKQRKLVEAQTESLRMLNESVASFSEAVAEFRGMAAEVSDVVKSEMIEVDVNDSSGSWPVNSNEVGPILEWESLIRVNDGALGANEVWW